MNEIVNQPVDIVRKLLSPGKGLLAADESLPTIEKRFAKINVESTEETRRAYRQLLFTTEGLEEFISGVIMFDETVRQKTDDGVSFPEYLTQKGIVPGIKVDGGLEAFNGTDEQVTKGLEGLEDRLKEYFGLGLRFTKWRGVFRISDIFPSKEFLEENLERMSEFASISQSQNFVPIVEPEILLEGIHTTSRCQEVSLTVWNLLFEKLSNKGVELTNLVLKTSMVLPGKDSLVKAAPLEVAQVTLSALRKSVPKEVPGIFFLSGGQSPDEATNNLNEIVKLKGDAPWELSFSFARALQDEAMNAWQGRYENLKKAQDAFRLRASLISKARRGELK